LASECVTWMMYAALDPPWLYRFAGMPPALYPEIFAGLGMVFGLYGLLYRTWLGHRRVAG